MNGDDGFPVAIRLLQHRRCLSSLLGDDPAEGNDEHFGAGKT
jgi:hypothetical protein